MTLRLTVPVGTRPEVIKLAPVVRALIEDGHAVRCIATGQHVDARMYGDLFDEARIRPDAAWQLRGSEGDRLGSLLAAAFDDVAQHPADAVLVLGDTYTAPLVAMAARSRGIGVLHLEAGLRSFNPRSVEEVNRRMMVALATVHFAPTALAARFLADDGVPAERVRVVGNPVIDAVVHSGVAVRPVGERAGVLLTAHRATNVDDPGRLLELVDLVRRLGAEHGPVTFPLHPRTRDRLTRAGLLEEVSGAAGVLVCEPLPYEELLRALASSRVVVTDSGGLQEEAAWFGVPSVVMRHTTPRWEGVHSGAVLLTGMAADAVLDAVRALTTPAVLERVAGLACPYGTGDTARQVSDVLAEPGIRRLLAPTEPALGSAPAGLLRAVGPG